MQVALVVYLEAHMGLKEVGMPTKLAMVGIAFIFAPAFMGEEKEEPVGGISFLEAEQIAAARRRRRQHNEACKRDRQAQPGAGTPQSEGVPPARTVGGKHKQE